MTEQLVLIPPTEIDIATDPESVIPAVRDQTQRRIDSLRIRHRTPLNVVSLFSGCGGLDLGFRGDFLYLGTSLPGLGYKLVWANDNASGAVGSYKHNIGSHIYLGGIQDLDKSTIPNAAVVIGGFPCKDFSLSGSCTGINGAHGRLYLEMRDVINAVKPFCFIAENVANLLKINEGADYELIRRDFEEAGDGYTVTHWLLDATQYGLAQTRKRVFIVGFRNDFSLRSEDLTPPPILLLPRPVSSFEAIDDLRTTGVSLPNQDQLSRAGLLDHAIRSQGDEVIRKHAPGPTIRATHHGRIQFHYEESRRITVREAARIQSFPDSFVFTPNMTNNYRQVGNAVPPVLGWHVAARVREILDTVLWSLPAPTTL